MTRLVYDFADPSDAKLFPMHGWATNSQGVKILWCPLRHLVLTFRQTGPRRLPAGDGVYPGFYPMPFSETLRKLALTLRELHELIRVSCDDSCNSEGLDVLRRELRAMEMVPLYVDLAFVYLRRLPDLLVLACRPLMFEHWQSVPQEFKTWVADVDRLQSYRPSCDFAVLRDTILSHSAWFSELRGISPSTRKKGIRDALEHRGIRLLVGKQQSGGSRPRFSVITDARAPDVESHQEILHKVPESVAGLCRLMTGVHSAIGVGSQYEDGDYFSLQGTDDDFVGYWPPIHA